MKYNFDTIIDRSLSDCEKYRNNDAVFGTSDLLPLWIADMDFASGEFIIDALVARARHGVLGYGCRCDSFWEAIRYWLDKHTSWKVEKQWLEFSPGVVAGVVFAMQSVSSVGDGILIQPPVYHPFANVIRHNGRRVVDNPMVQDENGDYHIDFEDFEQKVRQVKAFILCNPQNPTGRVFTLE
ncbi:MAG: aminotransferase class I/II-fold pyridoxal phosphate-dependent enzyme, partial [Rikenellaceae bacterium]